MDIYEDYVDYLDENHELIEKLRVTSSPVFFLLQDVINVLDYIYRQKADGEKIEADLEEIFDIGFGYISNVVNDLSIYYNEYFDKSIKKFNEYGELIVYNIMIDDIRSYLESMEVLDDERKANFDEAEELIEDIIKNNKPIDPIVLNQISQDIETSTSTNPDYKPVYVVFAMISEELNLI